MKPSEYLKKFNIEVGAIDYDVPIFSIYKGKKAIIEECNYYITLGDIIGKEMDKLFVAKTTHPQDTQLNKIFGVPVDRIKFMTDWFVDRGYDPRKEGFKELLEIRGIR